MCRGRGRNFCARWARRILRAAGAPNLHEVRARAAGALIFCVPQARSALDAAGLADTLLVAAGGVADGRGLAAALALGAARLVFLSLALALGRPRGRRLGLGRRSRLRLCLLVRSSRLLLLRSLRRRLGLRLVELVALGLPTRGSSGRDQGEVRARSGRNQGEIRARSGAGAGEMRARTGEVDAWLNPPTGLRIHLLCACPARSAGVLARLCSRKRLWAICSAQVDSSSLCCD